jgi:aryl-alcohol dehydrogenase-like predicted oxidoreductase
MDYGVQGSRKTPEDEAYRILKYAVENGVNIFDNAPGYGEAESILGAFIASREEGLKVVTKLDGKTLEGVAHKDVSRIITDEALRSCTALNLDRLDGYLLHDPKHMYDREALTALNALKVQGIVGNIGVSIYSPQEALDAADNALIDYIQVPYNAFDHRLEKNGFFELAKKNKKTVFARSIFLQGLLTMNPEEIPQYIASAQCYVERFHKLCYDAGFDYVEGSLAFVKSNQSIDYLVLGVDTLKQLKEILDMYNGIENVSGSFITATKETFSDMDERVINPTLWKT